MTAVLAANLLVWLWALIAFAHQPALLGASALAYLFGLRHAFDADHIASIDNVVRKLMEEGTKTSSVGLLFALGHSTVVFVATCVIASTAAGTEGANEALHHTGGIVGTVISSLFLTLVGAANLRILKDLWSMPASTRDKRQFHDPGHQSSRERPAAAATFFRPVFRLVSRPWHMYLIGALFALAFDTAAEIAVLGISTTQVAHGTSFVSILVFPMLFAAGMCLADAADSVLMTEAYGLALEKPLRKRWYNLVVTAGSGLVALIIGGTQIVGLIGEELGWSGELWEAISKFRADLSSLGVALVAIFAVVWVSQLIWTKWESGGRLARWSDPA
jgi:high-affinity nickel-transport protein